MKRKCWTCKITKELEEFARNRTKYLGYDNCCIICSRERDRQYYARRRGTEWVKKRARKRYEKIKSDPVYLAKSRAREKARYALKKGKIIQGKCISCNTEKDLQMHHIDYTKPLDIIWLCKHCHNNIHTKYKVLDKRFK